MNTYEESGLLTYKDKDENLYRLYPVTKKDCLLGMEYIDSHIINEGNPHGVTANQINAVPITRKINGLQLSKDIDLAPENIGIVLDTSNSIEGAFAEAKAVGDALKTLTNDLAATTNIASGAYSIATSKPSMQCVTVNLLSDLWDANTLIVNVPEATETNTVLVGPHPDSYAEYIGCAIRCTDQNNGQLTFVCEDTPSENVQANIIFLE